MNQVMRTRNPLWKQPTNGHGSRAEKSAAPERPILAETGLRKQARVNTAQKRAVESRPRTNLTLLRAKQQLTGVDAWTPQKGDRAGSSRTGATRRPESQLKAKGVKMASKCKGKPRERQPDIARKIQCRKRQEPADDGWGRSSDKEPGIQTVKQVGQIIPGKAEHNNTY